MFSSNLVVATLFGVSKAFYWLQARRCRPPAVSHWLPIAGYCKTHAFIVSVQYCAVTKILTLNIIVSIMSNISLWASDVSRDGLLQKITLLALLGPPQEHPRNHTLVATAEKRLLTIDQEAEVAGNLAFVARQSSDSQNVAAVGIEEDTNGQGMVVRVTANGSMLASVVGVLTCICQTLERIAANGKAMLQPPSLFDIFADLYSTRNFSVSGHRRPAS